MNKDAADSPMGFTAPARDMCLVLIRQDIYITTNRTREPGPNDYDAKGTNWAGSMTVMFSETATG